MQSEVFVKQICDHLQNPNIELKKICARGIFHLAEEPLGSTTVRQQGGLAYLMEMVKDKDNFDNLPLMAAGEFTIRIGYFVAKSVVVNFILVTGALWKVSLSPENVDHLEDLGIVGILIQILKLKAEHLDDLQFNYDQAEVLTNVVGALAETARLEVI